MPKAIKSFGQGLLCVVLPFLAGCGGGGDSASLGLGSLFSAAGALPPEAIELASASSLIDAAQTGEAVAAIVNPEPASLLLVGGGMAAMAFMKKQRSSKV